MAAIALAGLVVGCGGADAVATRATGAPAIAATVAAQPPAVAAPPGQPAAATAAPVAATPSTATQATLAPAPSAPVASGATRADFETFWNGTAAPGGPVRARWDDYVAALAKASLDYNTVKANPSVLDMRSPNYGLAYNFIILGDSKKLIQTAQALQLEMSAVPPTMAPLNGLLQRAARDGQDLGAMLDAVFSGELDFAAHAGELETKVARQRADNDAVIAFSKPFCDTCVSPTR